MLIMVAFSCSSFIGPENYTQVKQANKFNKLYTSLRSDPASHKVLLFKGFQHDNTVVFDFPHSSITSIFFEILFPCLFLPGFLICAREKKVSNGQLVTTFRIQIVFFFLLFDKLFHKHSFDLDFCVETVETVEAMFTNATCWPLGRLAAWLGPAQPLQTCTTATDQITLKTRLRNLYC